MKQDQWLPSGGALNMILLRRLLLTAAASALIANGAPSGFFARQALPIWNRVAGSPHGVEVVSPDGVSRVTARHTEKNDEEVSLSTKGGIGSGKVQLGAGVGSELLWAPDSRAFAVNTSDGGANGPYRAIIVAAGNRGLQVRDLSSLIRRAFGHPVKCDSPEYPNVAVVRWKDGARKVIVVPEIVSHGNCDSFGTFRAYEVDWRAMRITNSFDQLTAKRLFGRSLGTELRGAPDECIRPPNACWVSTNHLSDKAR